MRQHPIIKVRPYQDESPASVLLRSSSLNGYRTPTRQLNQLKGINDTSLSPSLKSIVSNQKQFELACEILGVAPTNLESIKPVREHELPYADYLIGGIFVRRKHFSKSTRYCPRCFNEKQYFRKIWDYELYTSCHEHGLAIIDHCDVCGEKISWNRRHISECQCGAKLGLIEISAKDTLAANIFFNTFNAKDIEQFELMMDMSIALAEHYKLNRYNQEIINLSALGVKKPSELAQIVLNEMQNTKGLHLHPILSFQAFINHPNLKVQSIAKLASSGISHNIEFAIKNQSNLDLSENEAAKILGVRPVEVRALLESGLLNKKSNTPDRTYSVPISAINELIYQLSIEETDANVQTMTIKDVIEASRDCYETYSLTRIVRLVLDGDIKLTSFSLKNPLSDSTIQAPKLRRLEKQVFKMVWIGDFADFVHIHPNSLREIIKSEKDIKSHTGQVGTNHPNKKFLTLIQAERLLKKFRTTYRESNGNDFPFEKLPQKDVEVLILNS